MSAARLRIETAASGEVMLSGVIDEHARLLELLERGDRGRLVLDLSGVTFINSLGVRDWIRFVVQAARLGLALELVRVAEPMVQQFNMILATRTGVAIRSFFAPFACDSCGREDSMCVEVEASQALLKRLQAPAVSCPSCGAPMAFNDFPERYFTFLTR